ncbi:uncharacterized protein [Chlorocebus sabaeus]|uniref:uncharacterized protein n=1 Tax=Chlorocebus sabaeus TaxID=60711 RepID=UPI003BFA0799
MVRPRRQQRRLAAPSARPSRALTTLGVTATLGLQGSDPGPPSRSPVPPGSRLSPRPAAALRLPPASQSVPPWQAARPRAGPMWRRPAVAGGTCGLRPPLRLPALGSGGGLPSAHAPGLSLAPELQSFHHIRPAQDGVSTAKSAARRVGAPLICPQCLI